MQVNNSKLETFVKQLTRQQLETYIENTPGKKGRYQDGHMTFPASIVYLIFFTWNVKHHTSLEVISWPMAKGECAIYRPDKLMKSLTNFIYQKVFQI